MNCIYIKRLLMWHNNCLCPVESTLLYISPSTSTSFWYDDAQSYTQYFRFSVTGIMQRRDHYPSSPWRASSVYTAWKSISCFSCSITFQVHGYHPAPWEFGNRPQQEQVHISSPTGWVCQPLRTSGSTSEEQVSVFSLNTRSNNCAN